jgi:hypothetical protein
MFTNEQMSGSGQLSMTDLIQSNENRIAELKSTSHTFWHDPGHGWLEVRYQDLIILDLLGTITGYSFRSGDKVYLEEDMDASAYIEALFGKYGERSDQQQTELDHWKRLIRSEYRENIFVRNLQHFK